MMRPMKPQGTAAPSKPIYLCTALSTATLPALLPLLPHLCSQRRTLGHGDLTAIQVHVSFPETLVLESLFEQLMKDK